MKATFAGGCFWGIQKYFADEFGKRGLQSSRTGYTGGVTTSPQYRQVCSGDTQHAEAVQLEYDPAQVDYAELVKFFFRLHDPTTANRQGNDVGTQYRSEIFYHDATQQKVANEIKAAFQADPDVMRHYKEKTIQTKITEAGKWWDAEDYHQHYLVANPGGNFFFSGIRST